MEQKHAQALYDVLIYQFNLFYQETIDVDILDTDDEETWEEFGDRKLEIIGKLSEKLDQLIEEDKEKNANTQSS